MSDIPRQIVTVPEIASRQCWVEKRLYLNSLMSRYAGSYARCEKAARSDHLTCWWHRNFEDEAQSLKTSGEQKMAMRAKLERETQAGMRSPNDSILKKS